MLFGSLPNDPCCASCGQQTPAGCPEDPTCLEANGALATLTNLEDPPNLRCFDQKRRFGIDYLYPVDRYIGALTQATIPNREGLLVPNPIFSDLDPSDSNAVVRDPGLVFVAGCWLWAGRLMRLPDEQRVFFGGRRAETGT